MSVLRCPVCGGEAAVSPQETDAHARSLEKPDAEIVVCHCVQSHRFVVSLKECLLSELCGAQDCRGAPHDRSLDYATRDVLLILRNGSA
jgi:hypothetical protein